LKYNSIIELIGKTPCVKINSLFLAENNIWLKLENRNPGGSIKDRIAAGMISEAEKRGDINSETVIIEPTSGNTGIGLAMICAIKKYSIIIVMPENLSLERRKIMAAYGAKIILTPKEKGMKGAIEKASSLAEQINNSWLPFQFSNRDNPNTHRNSTANEIIEDFPEGIDFFIAGIGTGGHITGCGEKIKEKFPQCKIIAVEPASSPFLSKKTSAPHLIQGIGAGFQPENVNMNIIDKIITVSDEDAYYYTKQCALKESIFIGISSGASLAACSSLIQGLNSKTILCFCYDSGDKYLSVENLF